MKNMKKLVMAITALTMSATSAFALSACKDKHTHDYKWTVTTEAGCESEGLETGICEADGNTTTRPVPATGHAYGNWQITKPTAAKEGEAVKVCGNDNQHIAKVTLPKLTADGTGYTKVTDGTTQSGVPSRTYTYTDATYGAVEFTTVAVATVDEAVRAGNEFNSSVLYSKADRTGTQSRSIKPNSINGGPFEVVIENKETGKKEVWSIPLGTAEEDYLTEGALLGIVDDELTEVLKGTPQVPYFKLGATKEVLYEQGDNYIHVKNDAERTERFYNLDDEGNIIFPVSLKWIGGGVDDAGNKIPEKQIVIKDEDASEDNLKGFGYSFTFYGIEDGAKFYGVGPFVSKLYEYAKVNPNKDFAEDVTEEDGKTVYSFSFGEYRDGFHKISVKFTLNDDCVIDWAELECKSYRTSDWDSENNEASVNATVKVDGEGYYSVNAGHEDHWVYYEHYSISQKSSYEQGKTPTNPYKYEDMLITEYAYNINGATEVEGKEDTYTVAPLSPVRLQFRSIQPSTYNGYFDNIRLYERVYSDNGSQTDAQGRKYDDVELSNHYEGGSDGHIQAAFDNDNYSVVLNAYVAGTHTVVMRSVKTEKLLTLEVDYIAPQRSFLPDVYAYDEVKEQGMWLHGDSTATADVYVGQKLYFNSFVDHPAYEDGSFTATVKNDADVDVTDSTLGTGKIDGVEYSTFVAQDPGVYTITITSTASSSSSRTIEVTVAAPLEVSDVLNGNYWNSDNEEDKVVFTHSSGAVSGKVTLNLSLGHTVLENVQLSYAYNKDTKQIAITDVPEAHKALDIGLVLTESYNLFLTYTDSFGVNKRIYLINATPNEIAGNYILGDNDHRISFVANALGDYVITLPSTSAINYSVNGSISNNMTSSGTSFYRTFKVRLGVDDEFEIWSNNIQGKPITIRYNELFAPTEVTLDKTELTASINNTYTLSPSFDLNATATDVLWTSSDTSIATVNANGVVTAVAAGTATITCTAKYNSEVSATCEVTVINNAVTSVSLDKTSVTLSTSSSSMNIIATLIGANPELGVSNSNVTWASSDTSVVAVSTAGLPALNCALIVKTTAGGTATITVTTQDGSFTATCEVTVVYVNVASVSLDKTNVTDYAGNTLTLTPTLTGANGDLPVSNTGVTWTSSDTDIATVSTKGVVTLKKDGEVTITCTSKNNSEASAQCVITVANNAVVSVSLPETASVIEGSTATLTPTFTGEVADKQVSNKTVTWTSSDTTIATVNASGVVTGIAPGTVTITVTTEDGNKTASCTVTVKEKVIALGAQEFTFKKNSTSEGYKFTGEANTEYNFTFCVYNASGDATNVNSTMVIKYTDPGSSFPGENYLYGEITLALTTDANGEITFDFETYRQWNETWTLRITAAVI